MNLKVSSPQFRCASEGIFVDQLSLKSNPKVETGSQIILSNSNHLFRKKLHLILFNSVPLTKLSLALTKTDGSNSTKSAHFYVIHAKQVFQLHHWVLEQYFDGIQKTVLYCYNAISIPPFTFSVHSVLLQCYSLSWRYCSFSNPSSRANLCRRMCVILFSLLCSSWRVYNFILYPKFYSQNH